MIGAQMIKGMPKAKGGSPAAGSPSRNGSNGKSGCGPVDVLRSGRWGQWVYYVRGVKQCRRRYVRPKDPRTPAQLRCRARLAAAAKAFSANGPLTPGDRREWIEEGAKVQSRVRLGQSGPLTGQQQFVGRNCGKERMGLGMLVRPGGEGQGERGEVRGAKSEIRGANGVRLCDRLDRQGRLVVRRSTWGQYRGSAVVVPGLGWERRKKVECRRQNGGGVEVRWRGHWRERWRGG
jgi:hypothetical protein